MRREAATHAFDIGQVVRLRGGFSGLSGDAETYQVTARLPPRGESLQYRIRSDTERYERVATQDNLEAFTPSRSATDTGLREATFGPAANSVAGAEQS